MYINPSLNFTNQFIIIKQKIANSVKKLIAIEITAYQAYIYFNMYLIRSIFFGYRVVSITDKQEKEPKTIYETPLLNKLQLREKFPRKVLYTRCTVMGVGIIQPKTAIAMAMLRLYFQNIRTKSSIGKMILTLKELMESNTRYSARIINIHREQRF